MNGVRTTLAVCALALLGGCASAEGPETMSITPEAKPAQRAAEARVDAADQAGFAAWRDRFRARARAAGIADPIFDAAFAGVRMNARVLELDAYQAEFARPIWEYLDRAVSDTRVAKGREELILKTDILRQIEERYGVDRQVVLAIWGLESAYGANYGDIPVIESLATLAYHGRRAAWAEEQLIEALKIIQSGDIQVARMVGSWAGAMGHTQFIPTSYQAYAVDFAGDGRRDIWSADAVDALASTANYLSRFGWRKGEPWGVEAKVPAGFDYALADGSTRRAVAFWRDRGVTAANGAPLPDHGEAAIVAPAGARGPAFAIFHNFGVIKRYNNATSYALAVGHLGDRIKGGGPFAGAWPRGDRPLSRNEQIEMQTLLTRLGFDTGGTDGIIGPNSRDAIRGFQRAQGQPQDGYASAALLTALRRAAGAS